jgi:cytoskeletal protein RodZ
MSDHEFEKQVQQKLGELKLRPSDAVWMEVEKNIRDKKRRRRFLWFWSAALLVALTTSGLVLYHYTGRSEKTVAAGNTTPAASASTSSSNQKTNTVSPNSTNTQASPIQPNASSAPAASGNETGNTSTIAQHQSAIPDKSGQAGNEQGNEIPPAEATVPNGNKGTYSPSTGEPVPTAREGRGEASTIPLTVKDNSKETVKNNNKKLHKKGNIVNTGKKKTMPAVTNEPHITIPEDESDLTIIEATQQPDILTAAVPVLAAHSLDPISTNKAAPEPFSNMPLNALMPDSAASANAMAAMPIQRKTPSLWHWGVKADAGYSRISVSKLFQLKGLLGTEKSYAEDLSARSYSSPASGNSQFLNVQASTTPVKVASPIQPDFSASAGVFIQRTLSPRLKVSVGVEYSYMSVNTGVGKSFDSSIAVNIGTNSLKVVNRFYESPGYIDTVRGTYASFQGQGSGRVYYSRKHRYRFHYIEIPVLLNWQINEGKRLPPIVFEGGVSIGRLFSADALHYEGVKGVYYEDNSLFNKTQFNFVTGLNVGLLQKSKHPIWIGPDLRYSLNGLVKKEVSTGQYMWSTGISFKMLLGRL